MHLKTIILMTIKSGEKIVNKILIALGNISKVDYQITPNPITSKCEHFISSSINNLKYTF